MSYAEGVKLAAETFGVKLSGDPQGMYRSFFTGELRRDATFFPPGAMARAKPKELFSYGTDRSISPGGPLSAARWLTYYINRAGKNLDPAKKKRLQKAKFMLLKEHWKQKGKA